MSLQQERKAKAILEKITKVDDTTWLLPSKSDDSKMHTVQLDTKLLEYECDCLGYIHTLNCYHIIAVKMKENKKEIKGLKETLENNDPDWDE